MSTADVARQEVQQAMRELQAACDNPAGIAADFIYAAQNNLSNALSAMHDAEFINGIPKALHASMELARATC